MQLRIKTRSGRELVPGGLQVDATATLQDLQKAVHRRHNKLYPERQRFTLLPPAGQKRGVVITPGKTLSSFGLKDGDELIFKDLGPQVGYAAVFFWEYFGPMVVYALIYFFPHLIYPWAKRIPEKGTVQTLAFAYWEFHYAKRIAETFLVHRFSHGTMPINNLFRNCGYYWLFTAFVAYFINHPLYTSPSATRALVCLSIALLCQACNFRCHQILADLRSGGSKEYKIPKGFAFNHITCANYFFEIWGWLLFGLATQTLAAFLFIAAGGFQMMQWALQKHKRLQKLFDGKEGRPKYPRRWVIFPPLL
eukprot:jgi/Astpho2/799/Aster-00653